MSAEFRTQLNKIREIIPRLDRAAGAASAIVAEVAAQLDGLDVGLPGVSEWFHRTGDAAHPDDAAEPALRRHKTWQLRYDRVPGGQHPSIHILVQSWRYNITLDDDSAEVVAEMVMPFDKAPRSLRLAALAGLPDLLSDIARKTECAADDAEETVGTIRAALDDLDLAEPRLAADLGRGVVDPPIGQPMIMRPSDWTRMDAPAHRPTDFALVAMAVSSGEGTLTQIDVVND